MYIPVRLPNNAFDLSRATKEMSPPPHAKVQERKDALAPGSYMPSFPPGLRDVNGDLDRLLMRLSPTSNQDSRRSRADLQFEPTAAARATTLSSTAALNRAATSYDKVQLTFGNSTSTAQLSGTYAGTGAAAAATGLSVVIDSNATVTGAGGSIAFRVTDQTGATLLSYAGAATAGEKIDLGAAIGLSISFSEGTLVSNESAFTSVSRTLASDVNIDATFNASNVNSRPRFEDDLSVGAGSFTINGKSIEVRGDDSIAAVLRRINEQAPDLIASFANDAVTITTADNTRRPIEVGNDSSGFLAATKLLGAGSTQGYVGADQERLQDAAQFAAVRAGGFRMGGSLISVDPTSDTLATVLARMSQASPGATAFYDRAADAVVMRGDHDALALSDDTSGFLAAIGLDGARVLREREGMTLAPGTAARLKRNADSRDAEIVARTFAGLTLAPPSREPVKPDEKAHKTDGPGPASAKPEKPADKTTAARARVAYGREGDESRERRVAARPAFAMTLRTGNEARGTEVSSASI